MSLIKIGSKTNLYSAFRTFSPKSLASKHVTQGNIRQRMWSIVFSAHCHHRNLPRKSTRVCLHVFVKFPKTSNANSLINVLLYHSISGVLIQEYLLFLQDLYPRTIALSVTSANRSQAARQCHVYIFVSLCLFRTLPLSLRTEKFWNLLLMDKLLFAQLFVRFELTRLNRCRRLAGPQFPCLHAPQFKSRHCGIVES